MKRVPAACCAMLLSACAALQPVAPERTATYFLEPESAPAAVAAPTRRDLVIAVSASRARAGFDTPMMAYLRRPNTLEYFARSRWLDTPGHMLAPLAAQALERSGAFRAVVQEPSPAAAALRLDTELVRLYQDFSAKPSRIRLTLKAQLVDLDARRVVAAAEFDETEAATSDDPYGGVRAANRALGRLLGRLADFCADPQSAH